MEQKYYFAWTLSSQQSDGQTNCLMKTQDHDSRYVVVIKWGKKIKNFMEYPIPPTQG